MRGPDVPLPDNSSVNCSPAQSEQEDGLCERHFRQDVAQSDTGHGLNWTTVYIDRVTELNGSSLASHLEQGTCFVVVFKGHLTGD